MTDTLMVTTGPIPPLPREQWSKVFINAAAGLYCIHTWLGCLLKPIVVEEPKTLADSWDALLDGLTSHATRNRLANTVDAVAIEMFPERVVGGLTALRAGARVNDHPDTTYADVCKILDEANRRLA